MSWLRHRSAHAGLHGPRSINRQRRRSLFLAVFSFVRMGAWLALMLVYALGGAHSLFQSLPFVAMISLYANAATDYGAGSANLAELTAGDAHSDSEHARTALQIDFAALETDIAQLAALGPGPQAQLLAHRILGQLPSGAGS